MNGYVAIQKFQNWHFVIIKDDSTWPSNDILFPPTTLKCFTPL